MTLIKKFRDFISSRTDRNNIVNFGSLSQEHLKSDFLNYYFNDIRKSSDVLPSSTLSIITNMLSGLLSTLLFKQHQLVREHSLTTATLDDNVISLAKNYGYNINRPVAPLLEVIYNGDTPMSISYGYKVGTLDNLDVVYFDESRLLERGDIFYCKVGLLKNATLTAEDIDNEGLLKYHLTPSSLSAIELDSIVVQINNDAFYPVSRSIEDFLVYSRPVEFSVGRSSTLVYLQDTSRFYGLSTSLSSNVNFKLIYLETDGPIASFNRSSITNISPDFEFNVVSNLGKAADSFDDIRFYARSLFTTARRCVTLADFRLVLGNHPYLHSVFVEKDRGLPHLTSWFVSDIHPSAKYLVFPFLGKLYYIDIPLLLYRDFNQRDLVYKFSQRNMTVRYGQTWLTHEELLELVFKEMQKHLDLDATLDFHRDSTLVADCDVDRVKSDAYINVEVQADSDVLGLHLNSLDDFNEAIANGSVHTLPILPEDNLDPIQVATLSYRTIQAPLKPQTCCTLIVYYIASSTLDVPDTNLLSKGEMTQLSHYMTHFKGETRLIYIPATEFPLDFNISLRISDSSQRELVQSLVTDILSEYEFKLAIEFNEDIILARIASLLNDSGYLVDGIYPSSHNTHNFLSKAFLSKRYIRWQNIQITWL